MAQTEISNCKINAVSVGGSSFNNEVRKRASRKMYIPIKIQTNAIKNDDIAINVAYISLEDLTNEVARKKGRKRGKNVEIRYLESIKSLRDKIMNSYSPYIFNTAFQSCSKERCPAVKERLTQHQLEHHKSSPEAPEQCNDRPSLNSCSNERCPAVKERLVQHQLEDQKSSRTTTIQRNDWPCKNEIKPQKSEPAVESMQQLFATEEPQIAKSDSISQKSSILKRTISPRITEHQSMQTTPVHRDFSQSTRSYPNISLGKESYTNLKHSYLDTSATAYRPTETKISFTTRNGAMKCDLQNVIMNWYEDIPVYPDISPSTRNLRKNLLNEFIEKIYYHINDAHTIDSYENNVKKEVDSLLKALPVWYPGAKRNQDMLKDNIKNNLLNKIRELRDKMYYEKSVNVQTDENITPTNETTPSQFETENIAKLFENEILDWLMQIKFRESENIGRTVNIIDTTDIFTKRLMPVLKRPACSKSYKLVIKSLIVNTLNDLPHVFRCPKNKRVYFNRIAEELTNRILYIQVKCRNSNNFSGFPSGRNSYQMTAFSNSDMKRPLIGGFRYSFNKNRLHSRFNAIEDVTELLVDCVDSIDYENNQKRTIASEIKKTLMRTSGTQATVPVSDAIVQSVRDLLTEDIINNANYSNRSVNRTHLTSTVSVFNTEEDITGLSNCPVTSTPKSKREIVKQNPEEISYTNKIAEIIRAWMETLPNNFDDDQNFKETIIMDLAVDIVDQLKTEQLVPLNDADKNKMMYYTIFRWLYRFDVFEENLSEEVPEIRDLQKRLSHISVPDLTRPRHGNRQAIANTKMNYSDRDFFVPKGTDVLEDEISIWMNEQPSDIYSKGDNDYRNKLIHELAKSLQKRLTAKSTENDINNDISSFLQKILKSSEKKNVVKFTDDLKNRIMNLPQDETLNKNLYNKIQGKLQAEIASLNPDKSTNDFKLTPYDVDPDRTLKEFIAKYMEHNYDVDDTVARAAFGEILKTEIWKLNPPTRKEVYENFTKPRDEFSTDRLDKELQYIKIVSDWLKNIPIDSSFNTPHNKKRIEVVNDLARNIYEVEEERRRAPTAMDYDMYLASIVSQFTNILPIPPEHLKDVMFMVDELIGRVIADRTPLPCCQNANQTLSSTNTTGIPEQTISEFIHQYIHLNANEFADDQMKMDAWSARLMKEVKKIVQSTADPSTLCKNQVYSKLVDIPIPEDESVRLFGLELGYAKEISDWMKNMPLLHSITKEASDERVKLISELAEKFSQRERNKITDSSKPENNRQIEEFIAIWIRKVPLDPKKEIDIPILTKQLLRRIEKVNKGSEGEPLIQEVTDKQCPVGCVKSNKNKSKINKSRSKTKRCNPSCCASSSNNGSPGQVIVEAIEKWSKNLPVKSDNKDTEKTIKDDVARKLYQKVGDLSVDPQIMNDDGLFQELLTDEVNAQINSLPQSPDIEKKKEFLKNDLIEKVMEGKSMVKEAVAGKNYKIQLENTIEASIPAPVTNRQWYDPGFEIYKNRLADMFILDNFDHGNDVVKVKYERKIKDEIDKYFESAKKRNAVPISKDEIYNELYSALFKVPIPNEASAIAEVEEVKTRCELDIWFEGLPLRETSDLTEQLEWDKILSMLAKRLHQIETNSPNPDEQMKNEIVKWVQKFPLLQGQDSNVDKFATDLQDRLKTSKENRKCVTSSGKGKEIKKGTMRKLSRRNKSQVGGSSNEGRMSISSKNNAKSETCCQISQVPRKKPAELVLEVVESWCNQLPLPVINPENEIDNKIVRDNLLTQIIIKICALNGSPQTFNDPILYEYFLDAELEHLLLEVPLCCQSAHTKNIKRKQLTSAILSLLPAMKEEKACYEYKLELKTSINNVLKEPLDTTAEKIAEFNQLKDEIVDNFVQYYYNRDDDEGKQIYRENLYEIVSKYLQDLGDRLDDPPVDPLIKQNQLLCEMAKVPIPCERIIKEEVEEIKMKDEVIEFFENLNLPEDSEEKMTLRKNIQHTLAKRLYQIENTGHNCENDSKMKKETVRCLKKIDLEVSPDIVDAFIAKLKNNEAVRKALPIPNKAIVSPPKRNSDVYPGDVKVGKTCGLKECDSSNRISSGTTPLEYQAYGGDMPNHVSASIAPSRVPESLEPTNSAGRFARGQVRTQVPNTDADVDTEDCKCERRMKRRRGRPRCFLRMEDYCEECEQFRHMWMPLPYRMPLPRYYYY